ncbi:MAG: hypothetical protein PHY28_09750, partial [Dehalococcoidales bacterium]|nr:hypothetical protein [Dehalococcoidales bacterium]
GRESIERCQRNNENQVVIPAQLAPYLIRGRESIPSLSYRHRNVIPCEAWQYQGSWKAASIVIPDLIGNPEKRFSSPP